MVLRKGQIMSRKRSLKEIQEDIRTLTRVPSEFIHAKLDELAEEIGELAEPKWIPCSEKMPEERDSIFARWKGTDKWDKGMFEKMSATVIAMVEYSNGERTAAPACTRDGKWRCDCIICGNGKVIAWMPLPEPYKESGYETD